MLLVRLLLERGDSPFGQVLAALCCSACKGKPALGTFMGSPRRIGPWNWCQAPRLRQMRPWARPAETCAAVSGSLRLQGLFPAGRAKPVCVVTPGWGWSAVQFWKLGA